MKHGTTRHPKTVKLAKILKCEHATAVGYLQLLWDYTAEFAPTGDVSKYGVEQVEYALEWHGRGKKTGQLMAAFVEAGWVDQDVEVDEDEVVKSNGKSTIRYEVVGSRSVPGRIPYLIHDWPEHAEESVKRKLARAGQGFLRVRDNSASRQRDDSELTASRRRDVGESSAGPPLPIPIPIPEPLPSSVHNRDGVPAAAPCITEQGKPGDGGEQSFPENPGPPRVPAPTLGAFGLTAARLRQEFPSVDDPFVLQIVTAAIRAWIGVSEPQIRAPDDALLVEAIDACLAERNGHAQNSAGLFLSTVPRVIVNWARHGKSRMCRKQAFVDRSPRESDH